MHGPGTNCETFYMLSALVSTDKCGNKPEINTVFMHLHMQCNPFPTPLDTKCAALLLMKFKRRLNQKRSFSNWDCFSAGGFAIWLLRLKEIFQRLLDHHMNLVQEAIKLSTKYVSINIILCLLLVYYQICHKLTQKCYFMQNYQLFMMTWNVCKLIRGTLIVIYLVRTKPPAFITSILWCQS